MNPETTVFLFRDFTIIHLVAYKRKVKYLEASESSAASSCPFAIARLHERDAIASRAM